MQNLLILPPGDDMTHMHRASGQSRVAGADEMLPKLRMAGDVLDHRIGSQTIVWALVVGSKSVPARSFNAR